MGKRKKNKQTKEKNIEGAIEDTTENISSNQEIDSTKHKKKKKKIKLTETNNVDTIENNITEVICTESNKDCLKKINEIIQNQSADTEKINEKNATDFSDVDKTKSKIMETKNVSNQDQKPKKNKFGNDGEPMILDLDNSEESNIKDEEIDQFCDEIDEEDNKQYERWITILEQKLSSTDNDTLSKKKRKKKRKNLNKAVV